MALELEVEVFCTKQNQVSNLQIQGPHTLFQVFGPGLLGPMDVIPSLQDLILEVLGEVFHSWALTLWAVATGRFGCLQ